jgi:hypothetical protein
VLHIHGFVDANWVGDMDHRTSISLGKKNWKTIKMVFRYFCGTISYELWYQGRTRLDRVLDIHGFVDAKWDGYMYNRISTSWYVFNLFGGAISWMSKRQVVVALSTTEVEYMASTHAIKEEIWLQILCLGIGLVQQYVRIDCDSQSAIFLAKNPTYHSKTKHIDIQYHFVRDMVEEKKILLMKVDTLKNVADSLTKSVSIEKFSWCIGSMAIFSLDFLLCNLVTPCMKRKQQVGECWYVLYSLHD